MDPTTAATPLPLPLQPPPKWLLLLKRIFATVIPELCFVLPWRNMRIVSSNVFMVASRSLISFSNILICLTFLESENLHSTILVDIQFVVIVHHGHPNLSPIDQYLYEYVLITTALLLLIHRY